VHPVPAATFLTPAQLRGSVLRMRYSALMAFIAIGTAVGLGGVFPALFDAGSDHPSIQYASRPVNDPASDLDRKLQAGAVRLEFDAVRGYLPSLLEALRIPVSSQMLVFSKTSLQQRLISPHTPRALFFNDSVVVGWVNGGRLLEVAAQDPEQGVIFYSLNQRRTDQPRLERRDDCLNCHESSDSLGVPGMLVRSEFAAADGRVQRRLGRFSSDHGTPVERRWGGWYVSGHSGSIRHMGNATFSDTGKAQPIGSDGLFNLRSVDAMFDTGAYLSPYSDIVALLVFEHQMRMINLLTRVGWEARLALYLERGHTGTGPAENTNLRPDRNQVLRDAAVELVDYLLFVDEVPLDGRIEGTSGFAQIFSARRPFDSRGRSLRQFDLERRLMRYPCSYMIYTEAFDALPPEAGKAVYERLWRILSGEESDPKYARLGLDDRRAIVEILLETKKGLPGYFQAVTR